jgi:hypothetical protein
MTEIITIRLRRSKSEIRARAKPNVNSWVNDLIDQALSRNRLDWDEHFARRAERKAAHYRSDEVRRASR